jgi:hypothetical protein
MQTSPLNHSQNDAVKQFAFGRKTIRRAIRNRSARYKGAIAAKLVTGELSFTPNVAEAAWLTRTHARVVYKALGQHPDRRPLTDAAIERYIARATPERVWAALDRLTEPKFSVAAE